MSGSILWSMYFIYAGMITILLFFSSFAKDPALGGVPIDSNFIQYLAGIELLEHSKSLSSIALAKKYKELCSITELTADSVAKRIVFFKGRPELWQQVRTQVLELLQSPR
jgi:hypothetical protein